MEIRQTPISEKTFVKLINLCVNEREAFMESEIEKFVRFKFGDLYDIKDLEGRFTKYYSGDEMAICEIIKTPIEGKTFPYLEHKETMVPYILFRGLYSAEIEAFRLYEEK